MEGIVVKIGGSKYEYGKRSQWKKFKCERDTLDVIVLNSRVGKKGTKYERDYVVFGVGVRDELSDCYLHICDLYVGDISKSNIIQQQISNIVVEMKYAQI